MNRPYQVLGTGLLCLAGFLGYEAWKLDYYSTLGPGPGFFPRWLSVALAALGLAVLWQATFGKTGPGTGPLLPDRRGISRIVLIVGAIIVVAACMEPLGFRLTMLAFYLVLLTALRGRQYLSNGVIAAAGSFGVHQVFRDLLAIPLPVGIFGI